MTAKSYAAVQARIHETPELQPYADIILYDWPEGEAHLEWALTAPVAEILDWAQRIRQGEEDLADQE